VSTNQQITFRAGDGADALFLFGATDKMSFHLLPTTTSFRALREPIEKLNQEQEETDLTGHLFGH
jgi:hypothetical protein